MRGSTKTIIHSIIYLRLNDVIGKLRDLSETSHVLRRNIRTDNKGDELDFTFTSIGKLRGITQLRKKIYHALQIQIQNLHTLVFNSVSTFLNV